MEEQKRLNLEFLAKVRQAWMEEPNEGKVLPKEMVEEIKNSIDKKNVDYVNAFIKEVGLETDKISDGYHTFGELYEHRITLFIALCGVIDGAYTHYHRVINGERPKHETNSPVWKSTTHSDGSVWEGWFILGMYKEPGKQVTYHLPISKWANCNFYTLDKAPDWDGHTSADVLERLKHL